MIQRITDYPGYLIRLSPSAPSNKAILMLHGFPANRGVRNLDVADCLNRHFNRAVYLLHYRGLGESPGDFRFTDSLQETRELVDRLTEREGHDPLVLVGHSWGGLLAINMAKERADKIESAILLSPLCHLEKSEGLYDWFLRGVRAECPGVYGGLSDEAVRADLDRVLDGNLPSRLVPSLPPKVPFGIIQAKLDEVTPTRAIQALLPKFPTQPLYRELDLDHSFSQDRGELADAVIEMVEALG